VLLSAAAEKFRLKDASALTNFRARFAEQFQEVTEVLPQRMVIVIDDLDRCRPEAILDVMEAVNFLVSSGSCFVIFGMATERVQAALALSFDKIAAETADLTSTHDQRAADVGKETIDREQRRRYAQHYLEKLVNLEIVVPSVSDLDASRLFDRQDAGERDLWVKAWAPVARLWPIALVIIAVILGGIFGWRLPVPDPPPAPVVKAAAPADHTAAAVGGTASRPPTAPTPQEIQKYVPSVQLGDPRDISWPVFVIPLALLTACLAGLTLYRLRTAVHQVRDTRGFQDALRAWTPLVHSHRATPRAIKRFANRIRYLAMLHQAERLDESGFDTLRRRCDSMIAWIGGRVLRTNAQIPPTDPIRAQDHTSLDMAEENLVALGALNECFGPQWRNCATGTYDSGEQQEAIEAVLRRLKLIGCSSSWPPSQEELDAFEVSLGGIRAPAT
jgi:KAP family P-loop domain